MKDQINRFDSLLGNHEGRSIEGDARGSEYLASDFLYLTLSE